MTVNLNYPMTREDERAAARGALFGPLSVLARQKRTWSPFRLAGPLWRAITNIGRHRKVLKLLKDPIYAEFVHDDPRFGLKYLTHDYMSRGLTVAERAGCFVHHYRRLQAILPGGMLRNLLHRDITLLKMNEGDFRFDITMGMSKPHDKEGELSLNFLVDDEIVFILSFSIVPGRVVGTGAEDVLLITRLQGVRGNYRQIALATKLLHDVAPGALLVAALQGAGEALGIGVLASIRGTDQTAYCVEYHHSFSTAYDDFFTELGVLKNDANYYVTPIPIPEKPLLLVKQGHKLRTREKREFKRHVADAISLTLSANRRAKGRFSPRTVADQEPESSLENLYARL